VNADPRSRASRRRNPEDRLAMSMATKTDTQSPALHVAASHDLIREQS
jgi:hypothetical protein